MVPLPPTPSSPSDRARWEWSRTLRRLMSDRGWSKDLEKRLQTAIGHVRREAWGILDTSSNVYLGVWRALARSYDRAPIVAHEDVADEFVEVLDRSGLWPLMQSFSELVLGLRECLLRVDVTEDHLGRPVPSYRVVYPDVVVAVAHPDRPGQPVVIREARERREPDTGRLHWAWDVLDISDPASPRYQVLDADHGREGTDMSGVYLGAEGGLVGDAYPYRDSDDRPVIPYVLYHASARGCLWDPWAARSIAEGSLMIGVYRTYLGHIALQASHPQRWGIDLFLPSASWADEDGNGQGRNAVVADPATIVMFASKPDGTGQPTLGQFSAAADVEQLAAFVSSEERRLIAQAGVSTADALRVAADVRSGFAMAVSRDQAREANRKWEPQFRAGDLEVIRLTAILLNRATGSTYPEDGYQITYRGIPQSPAEKRAEREDIVALIDAGLLDRVSAYQRMHPGATDEQAHAALHAITAINSMGSAADDDGSSPREAEAAAQTDLAKTALNGAQVTAALEIVGKIRSGDLTKAMAGGMLAQFFNLGANAVEAILADVDSLPALTPEDKPQ